MKKILITGADSYIGTSFEKYISQWPEEYSVHTLDMISDTWKAHDFSQYDVVFHVAGLAHSDVGNASEETKAKYYRVNCDLAVETAKKAKQEGVKQFIFMSTMIIYGESAPVGKKRVVTRDTIPTPANFYGDSKWQADQGIRKLDEDGFKTCVLRPPMIYGPGSKGNYQMLRKLALKLPIFPAIENERSMLHIDNLCIFVKQRMDEEDRGIFFPQDECYVNTSRMVKQIAEENGRNIILAGWMNPFVRIASRMPGKIGTLTNKAFGNMVYEIQENTDSNASVFSIRDEKYSVLMSVYSKVTTEELTLSIDSMLNQTITPDQFILVKDGPLGKPLDKVIDQYCREYPDIFTIVTLDENKGLAYALNAGIDVCRNELIARMDSDDYSLPNRCELQLKAFSKDPELTLLGTQMQYFKSSTDNVSEQQIKKSLDMEQIRKDIRRISPFVHPSVMYRKSVVTACGCYDPELRRRQDYDLFSKMISQGYKAANLAEPLLLFRADADYVVRNKNKESSRSRILVQKRIYERGECSILDYLYISFAMRISMIVPNRIYQKLYLAIKSNDEGSYQ